MPKLTIIIVPGSFAPAYIYDSVVNPVKEQGYEIKALPIPTVGPRPGVTGPGTFTTMYDDAAFIAKEIEALADAGTEVVLVSHSYGGFPATESTKGLSVKERQREGKKGGVVRLAYMTVLLGLPGQSPANVLEDVPSNETAKLIPDERGWVMTPAPHPTTIFSGMSEEEAAKLSKEFAPHSIISFTNPLTHAGYKDIPVSYLFCEGDQTIPPAVQRKEIDMIERETGSKVDVTSINSNHVPTVHCPEKVVDWLITCARKSE
ncbi:Alpha/beta hydrolase fold-1 [Xylaria sp. CBS 124048]|nr:Alpha/beta hydrolase fold-1 [Xylaria sp. CBS 124048]